MIVRLGVPLALVVSTVVFAGYGDAPRRVRVKAEKGLVPVIRVRALSPREAGEDCRIVMERTLPDGTREVIYQGPFYGNEMHFRGRARVATRGGRAMMIHDLDGFYSEATAPSECVVLNVHRELPTKQRLFSNHHAVHCGIRIGGTYLLSVGPNGELRLSVEKPGRPYGDYLARR